MNDIVHT